MIFWGTFFPLISEAVTGEKSSLGPPWFDRYTTPLAIVLVLFTGIGPLLAWRRVSAGVLWRLIALSRSPSRSPARGRAVALLTDALEEPTGAAAVLLRLLRAGRACRQEFIRGAVAQRVAHRRIGYLRALGRVVARNRRRYGGYIVHAGIAVLFLGVAASSSFQTSRDVRL